MWRSTKSERRMKRIKMSILSTYMSQVMRVAMAQGIPMRSMGKRRLTRTMMSMWRASRRTWRASRKTWRVSRRTWRAGRRVMMMSL